VTMFGDYIVWDDQLWCNKSGSCESPLMKADADGWILLADAINRAQEHEREVHRGGDGD
jgi:hypothetical protein